MPYSNLPKHLWGKMERCTADLKAKGEKGDKIYAICYSSIMKNNNEQVRRFVDEFLETTTSGMIATVPMGLGKRKGHEDSVTPRDSDVQDDPLGFDDKDSDDDFITTRPHKKEDKDTTRSGKYLCHECGLSRPAKFNSEKDWHFKFVPWGSSKPNSFEDLKCYGKSRFVADKTEDRHNGEALVDHAPLLANAKAKAGRLAAFGQHKLGSWSAPVRHVDGFTASSACKSCGKEINAHSGSFGVTGPASAGLCHFREQHKKSKKKLLVDDDPENEPLD